MTDHLSLTQKWLRQNIQPYSLRDIVFNHVNTVLAAYPTLRPKTDVYTYDDGRSQLLLCVHGLLPIQYRSASYNIPIAVWLTLQYPTQPPLVYVVPTSDMLVKAGKHVDISGRCEPAYILTWQKKSEGCNLKVLMEVLTDQFSREPPVYAKPTGASPPPRSRQAPILSPLTPDNSNMPSPMTSRLNGGTSSPSPTHRPTPPPRPTPIPVLAPTRSPPPVTPHSAHAPKHNASDEAHYPPWPSSLIAQDPPIYSTPPNHAAPPPHTHIRASSAAPHSPPPVQPLPNQYPHSETAQPQRWSSFPGNVLTHPTGPPTPPNFPQQSIPVHAPASKPGPPPPIRPGIPQVLPAPTRNYLDEDVEDDKAPPAPPNSNAPPRPTNPEILRLHAHLHVKLTSEFASLQQALATDMQRLQTAQTDLLSGEPAIRDEMARLEAVRDVCRVVASRYQTTVDSAEMNLYELRKKGDPEVDELICSTTIVYNQLINLVAEDNAIEDTIYHLHRALNAGRIDLDKFLRTTRSLAEEQFMKRALSEKIIASIPMGAWS